MHLALRDVMARMKYQRAGGGIRTRCPAHGGEHFNVSWRDYNGEAWSKCFSQGCAPRLIRAAVLGEPARLQAVSVLIAPIDKSTRIELAQRIWAESRPAADTLVEHYLRSRGIDIVPASVSFHRSLRHPSGSYHPAMIACVTRVSSDRTVVGFHQTYLTAQGAKAGVEPVKAALGTVRGGAVAWHQRERLWC